MHRYGNLYDPGDLIEKISGEKLTLGRLLWAIRNADEITQVEFAGMLEISRQHLCDIEHNRKSISPSFSIYKD